MPQTFLTPDDLAPLAEMRAELAALTLRLAALEASPPPVADPVIEPVPISTRADWQAFVADASENNNRSADIGQWDELNGRPEEAIAQALANWPGRKKLPEPDGFYDFVLDPNNAREHSFELAFLYGKLKAHANEWQRQQWERHLKKWAEFMLRVTREGDSDEIIGYYFGLRMIDRVLGTDYCSRETPGFVSPATMRAIIRDYISKATGGEWIESSAYNLGTLSLLLLGVRHVGPAEFPEVVAWLPELAQQLVWIITADGRDSAQWGDEQDPHRAKLYAWFTLACQVIQLGGDKTGELAQLVACRIGGGV